MPWDTFGLEDIRRFCLLGCFFAWGYYEILAQKSRQEKVSKCTKILNYSKSSYVICQNYIWCLNILSICYSQKQLKHFAHPRDIFGLEPIRIFSTISSPCVLHSFKYFLKLCFGCFGTNDQKNQIRKTSIHVDFYVKYSCITFCVKTFQYSQIVYIKRTTQKKLVLFFFWCSHLLQNIHQFLGCQAIGISCSIVFF